MIKARTEKRLTQIELAKNIESDRSRISGVEKGTLNLSLEFLKK
ncbi:helix-turn-helix transcriptional regulator [Cetobacterium sp. 2A]|nr:helix-turn-helix transcriptional regulator [Cetobacterium sp. 2A]